MKLWKRLFAVAVSVLFTAGFQTAVCAAGTGTGSITIKKTEHSASLRGRTFYAYRILDAVLPEAETGEDRSPAYQVPEDMASWYKTYFSLESGLSGAALDRAVTERIAQLETDIQLQAFAKSAVEGAEDAGLVPERVTVSEDVARVVFDGLPYGYYAVQDKSALSDLPEDDQVIAAVALTTTAPDAEINLKAGKPKLEKKITSGNSTADGKANDVSVGSTVTFELKSSVPDTRGYLHYYYVIEDTLGAGLDYTADSVSFQLAGEELLPDTDYTFTAVKDGTSGETRLKLVLKDALQKFRDAEAGDEILMTYSAVLNEQALITVTDPAANTNRAKLIYSNDPSLSQEGGGDEPGQGAPVGETPVQETDTYTTQLKLLKTDGTRPLPGAEFTLTGQNMKVVLVTREIFNEDADGTFYLLKDGTYTEEAPDSGSADAYESTDVRYRRQTVTEVKGEGQDAETVTGTSGDNGEVIFAGLGEGQYHIEESVVPDGCNGIDPFDVTIRFHKDPEETGYLHFSAEASFVNGDGAEEEIAIDPGEPIEITVVNRRGQLLPMTGAGGTVLLSATGLLVMAAALFGGPAVRRIGRKKTV